jgi:hypothetical protein
VAKESGLGDNAYVGGYDLSTNVMALGRIGGGPQVLDATDITMSGNARMGGLRDGAIEFTAFFDDESGMAHPVLSALPTADALVTYCRGTTLGNPAACCIGKQIGYDGNLGNDGSLPLSVSVQSNGYGVEWGRLATAGKRTDTGATNGSSIDQGTGSTNFGLQAYLQVLSFTGTDVTITIEESSDDGAGDAFAAVTGGAFTQVTSAPTTERIYTARDLTVERYLRVATSTSGGFSEITFAVVIVRNDTTVTF